MQQDTAKQKRRIKQISIKKLFGNFDYSIPLNLEERITIIHGPNGFGKTTILRLLSEVFSQEELASILMKSNAALRAIPFEELHIDFDDGTKFWIEKKFQAGVMYALGNITPSKGKEILLPELNVKTSYADNEDRVFSFPVKSAPILPKSLLESILKQFSAEQWHNLPSQENESPSQEPAWLQQIRSCISVRLIETQRLLADATEQADDEKQTLPTVTVYAQEIAALMQAKLADSSVLSQSLDKTFPTRVFNPTKAQAAVSDKELRQRLEAIDKKRSNLTAIGLLNQDNDPSFQVEDQIDDSKKVVLSIYTEDTERKLSVFDEVATKIALLLDIMNKRFLYKSMTTDKDQGFVVTLENGDILPLESLSSGEHHALTLFYELLFKVHSKALVLIDEPEISLHVGWQMEYLQDIHKILRIADLDILIATHSPDIIGNKWDLTVKLEAPVR